MLRQLEMAPERLARRPGRTVARVLVAAMLLTAGSLVAEEDFRLQGLTGGDLTAGDLARGNAVVVVWASWSPRCRGIVEQVNGLVDRWGGRARIVTVNFQEERPAIEQFLGGGGLRAPVFLDPDGEFAKSHSVTTLPGLLVYKDGGVAFRGRLAGDVDDILRDALR